MAWSVLNVALHISLENIFDMLLEIVVVVRWHVDHCELWFDLELDVPVRVCLEGLVIYVWLSGFDGP